MVKILDRLQGEYEYIKSDIETRKATMIVLSDLTLVFTDQDCEALDAYAGTIDITCTEKQASEVIHRLNRNYGIGKKSKDWRGGITVTFTSKRYERDVRICLHGYMPNSCRKEIRTRVIPARPAEPERIIEEEIIVCDLEEESKP